PVRSALCTLSSFTPNVLSRGAWAVTSGVVHGISTEAFGTRYLSRVCRKGQRLASPNTADGIVRRADEGGFDGRRDRAGWRTCRVSIGDTAGAAGTGRRGARPGRTPAGGPGDGLGNLGQEECRSVPPRALPAARWSSPHRGTPADRVQRAAGGRRPLV